MVNVNAEVDTVVLTVNTKVFHNSIYPNFLIL
jgi:hypothetical protein